MESLSIESSPEEGDDGGVLVGGGGEGLVAAEESEWDMWESRGVRHYEDGRGGVLEEARSKLRHYQVKSP